MRSDKDKEIFVDQELLNPQLFVNALTEGIVVQNEAGEIILCNEAAEIISGLSKDQMTDPRYLELQWRAFHEDGQRVSWDTLPNVMAIKTNLPQENVVLSIHQAGGDITWVKINSFPVIDPSTDKLSLIVSSFTDLTKIRKTEQEIRSAEKTWKAILDSSQNGLLIVNLDYQLILANDQGYRILKTIGDSSIPDDERYLLNKLIPERRSHVKQMLDRASKGERLEYEVLYTKENNEDFWLLISCAPVRNDDGNIATICVTGSDISALKKNETAFLKSEQRWKFALDGAGDGVWEFNFQTKESYYSPLYKTMLGFTENEFQNETNEWRQRLHPDDVWKIAKIDQQYENREIENHSIEYRIKTKTGEYLWVLDRGMLLDRTIDGQPLTLIGTHKNITERKHAEEKLIKSQQLFTSFMANTPTLSWIIDEHAVFRYLNAPYMEAFELTEEAIGKSIYDIFPENICSTFVENNWKVWDFAKPIETIEEGIGPSGETQLYQIFKFPLDPEMGVRLLGGVALDITQKNLFEVQLAEEQEKKKQEIIHAIINAQEQERNELAYELHDNINQILSSSKLMLEVAVEKPDDNSEFVKRGLAYLQDAISEIRKLSHNLIPGTLRDVSLEAAIDELIQNINAAGKLKASYRKNISGLVKEIPPGIQLSVLRIAQAQFNNILKHSAATQATVKLDIDNQKIALSINDNGQGFNINQTKRGLGLNSIFNRTEYYLGVVKLTSLPGEGCTLQIEIPLGTK